MIKDGNIAAADDVMNLYGLGFKNQAQLIYNANLIGFNSGINGTGTPQWNKITYDVGQTYYNSATSNILLITSYTGNILKLFGKDYDVFNSSVDAAKWEDVGTNAGTLSETTTYIQDTRATQNSDLTLRAKAINISSVATTGQIALNINMTTTSNSGANGTNTSLVIRDEDGATVTLASRNQGSWNGTFSYNVVLTRTGADTINVKSAIGGYTGTVYGNNDIDVSSLKNSGNWQLQARCYGSGGTPSSGSTTIQWYKMLSAMNETITAGQGDTYISTAMATGSTYTDAILTTNNTANGATLTHYLSADGGAHWESCTVNQIHRFTNTGTDLRMKVVASGSSLVLLPLLNEYAINYNLGAS